MSAHTRWPEIQLTAKVFVRFGRRAFIRVTAGRNWYEKLGALVLT